MIETKPMTNLDIAQQATLREITDIATSAAKKECEYPRKQNSS